MRSCQNKNNGNLAEMFIWGKSFSWVTEISTTEPVCPLIKTHRHFYKEFSSVANSRKTVSYEKALNVTLQLSNQTTAFRVRTLCFVIALKTVKVNLKRNQSDPTNDSSKWATNGLARDSLYSGRLLRR